MANETIVPWTERQPLLSSSLDEFLAMAEREEAKAWAEWAERVADETAREAAA